jgi:hypothetical protein
MNRRADGGLSMSASHTSPFQPLDAAGREALARALGDTPETVISIYQLRNGLCQAYVDGTPDDFRGVLLDSDVAAPGEAMTFGSDADAIWELLRADPDWLAVDVVPEIAAQLGARVTAELGVPVRYLNDIYHIIPGPVVTQPHPDVRLLTPDDLPLLAALPSEMWGPWVGDERAVLEAGVVAGAVIGGLVVAIAQGASRSERHGDIGVYSMEAWRGRGYSTAAAALVAERLRAQGKTPTWSCGETNLASRRVAAKVGFVEVSRRVYVIK